MNVSLVLTPLSTAHAHEDDHEHMHVHSGHVHDFDFGSGQERGHHTIELKALVAHQAFGVVSWTDWVPLLVALALVWIAAPSLLMVLRPPLKDTEPISRPSFWHPPLRGPPLNSIQAR